MPLTPRHLKEGKEFDGQEKRSRDYELEWYANQFNVEHNALQFRIECARTSSNDGDEVTMFIRVTSDALRARQLFQQLGAELIAFMDVHGPIVSEQPRSDAR